MTTDSAAFVVNGRYCPSLKHDPEDRSVVWVFGDRLHALRKRSYPFACDFAQRLGISVSHLNDLECGREEVELSLLENIANALNVSLSYLLLNVQSRYRSSGHNVPRPHLLSRL